MAFVAKVFAFLSKTLLIPLGMELLTKLYAEFAKYLAVKRAQEADQKANSESLKKLDNAKTLKEIDDAAKDLINRL